MAYGIYCGTALFSVLLFVWVWFWRHTVYPKKYAHGFCFAVLCCGYTLTDFPISIRLTSLALWQSHDCPSASKQPWWIWINTSCEFTMNDCITTTKQSTTKPCAYFLVHTVSSCHCKNTCITTVLLTHWGRVTHICVSKLAIIGSDNGLSPGRRQAIIWTNAGILLIGPFGTNFSEILIEIHIFSLKKCTWKCRLKNGGQYVSASMC